MRTPLCAARPQAVRWTFPARTFRFFGAVLVLLSFATQRAAACTFDAPIGSPSQTGTTITVNWRFTCTNAPAVIELIQGATVWAKDTGNGSGKIFGSITNQTAMQPSQLYSGLQVCGGNSKILQYCSGVFNASTGNSGAQPGSNPQLTGLSVSPGSTPGTYVFSWTPSPAYTAYLASYDQDQGQQPPTHSPSATFTLPYSTPYTFNVEGGVFAGEPEGNSWSDVFASVNYTTPPPPPLPTQPPIGLQATYELPDSVQGAAIYFGWTDPGQAGVTDVPPTRQPGWPRGYTPAISITNNFHAFYDTAISSNTTYTYQICLKGTGGQACAQKSVAVPAIPPSCTQRLTCPLASNVPGTILYSCNAPVDFYESPTGSMTNATPEPNDSPTTYSGIDEVINPTYLLFCQKGSKTTCGALLQNMSLANCSIPPPVRQPPLRNCLVCISTQRQCKRVPGGYQCIGDAQ